MCCTTVKLFIGAPFVESEQEIKGNDVRDRNELRDEVSVYLQKPYFFVLATYSTFKCIEEPFKLSLSAKEKSKLGNSKLLSEVGRCPSTFSQ